MTDLARLAGTVLYEPAPAAEPVRFAASELARYLGRLFGRAPERCVHPAPGTWLSLGVVPDDTPAVAPGDEYAVVPTDSAIAFSAREPRALVAAVYAVLEHAGCRWSPHGGDDEAVPVRAGAPCPIPPFRGRAAFARRAYAADLTTWHYTIPERLAARLPSDVAFIDWMGKTGATGLLFIRHAHDSDWVVPALVPELARRGLAFEAGGHALTELLPRSLFRDHPDYFPARADGQRTDLGNVCSANRAALRIVAERARALSAALPGGTPLHVWGIDVVAGGWCRCPSCSALHPSDQALRVANAVAEAIDGDVFHLAYHDTLEAPRAVRPHARVIAEFAPRERCYAHALDEAGCATNAVYRTALETHLARFDGRVNVFEYYGDAILFGGCAVPLTEVVGRDLDYYARAGVRGVSCLTFGSYSLLAYGANVEAFARGTLEPGAAASATRARCARRYGTAAAAMQAYLAALERLMAPVVQHGDVLFPAREHEAAAQAACAAARAAANVLDDRLPDAGRTPLAAEVHLLRYTAGVLAAMDDGLAARLAGEPAARAAEKTAAGLERARAHLVRIDPNIAGSWAAHDVELTHAFFVSALARR